MSLSGKDGFRSWWVSCPLLFTNEPPTSPRLEHSDNLSECGPTRGIARPALLDKLHVAPRKFSGVRQPGSFASEHRRSEGDRELDPLHRNLLFPRGPPRHELPEHDPKRVHVNLLAILARLRLQQLGGHPEWGAHRSSQRRLGKAGVCNSVGEAGGKLRRRGPHEPAGAKVAHFDPIVVPHEAVVGLEVSVDAVEAVQVGHPPCHVEPHQLPARGAELSVRQQHLPERPERHELHHKERSAVRRHPSPIKDEQVRVPDLLHKRHLAVKVFVGHPAHIVVEWDSEHLDCDVDVTPLRPPDRAKAPARQLTLERQVLLGNLPRPLHLDVLGIERLLFGLLILQQPLVEDQVGHRGLALPVQSGQAEEDPRHDDGHPDGDGRLVGRGEKDGRGCAATVGGGSGRRRDPVLTGRQSRADIV
eukprot:m.472084 g.472084  ORF g.472084 m.472084 type:complete len:417 (+) comp32087_c0_seq1:11-1261(+)